ncbi:MAG: hypothetical protein GY708_27840 [Actinomycetia bacterium]|nr:hypothetical protein [Actinomycetes bacterium]MCP4961694.1 hypothetical protein [Actinomycetes bacterium]
MRDDVRLLRDGSAIGMRSTPVVPVVDTAELRWFVHGHAPADIVTWFTRDGAVGSIEERHDTYRLDGRPAAGIKCRHGETFELKIRRGVGDPVALTPGLITPVEHWRRWSPATDLIERYEDESWIDVHKAVVKRRFALDGTELHVSPELPGPGACDIEVVAISVGHVRAWSFALASFGQPAILVPALSIGWDALVANSGQPDLSIPSESGCGYPAWLARFATRDMMTSIGADDHYVAAG